jgi:Icc-related predicted phosphoesterase
VLLRRRRRAKDRPATATLDLYYASDVHGSEQCWRKFLGAGRFYGVQGLIMGGDLTGKAIVPITIEGDRFSATFIGESLSGSGEEELETLEKAIRYNGMYPWRAGAAEIAAAEGDLAIREELFERVMIDELRRWIDLADERMSEYGIDVFVMPGNDDPWSCDAVIEAASHVTACDDRVVRVGDHEMISSAYANPTPWNSPRELDEDALYQRLRGLADQLESPETAIFNLHVPPHNSGLDTANEINPDLTMVFKGGQPNPIPVGSTAVRQLIEEYQPLLALHGHIHESRGEVRIGRTLCVNSGSEYNSGRIHGVTVKLGASDVVSYQFVIG